ncbi:universal stress protein [Salinigranum marinum]|uniref:universal stress protein n=1 Tax=Salinigranum marinum TaxID=1515595 RepID=UPI002989F375|nr:universal stress protein [Salinigranum marinum]
MYETVLYPTDGSDTAEAAFEHALAIAAQFDATLHVVYVLEANEPPPTTGDAAARGDPDTSGRAAFEAATRVAAEHGIETIEAVLRGPTADAILMYADEKGIDLLVMGTHDRSGLDRLVIGSVTDEIVRESTVPVVVCRGSGED